MADTPSALNPLVLLLDGQGNILRWSRSFRYHSLQLLEALLGNVSWEMLFKERDAEELGSFLERGCAKDGGTTEHSWATHDKAFDMRWSALIVANPKELVEFVVVTGVRDGAKVRHPFARPSHGDLLEDAPAETWAFDRGTYRFVAVDEATTRRYGYSNDELRSMRILDVTPWEDVPRLIALVTDLEAEQATEVCWRHRHKDGRVFDVEAKVTAAESAGRPLCLVLPRPTRQL
jgi:PAS domain S-box-containing protein